MPAVCIYKGPPFLPHVGEIVFDQSWLPAHPTCEAGFHGNSGCRAEGLGFTIYSGAISA